MVRLPTGLVLNCQGYPPTRLSEDLRFCHLRNFPENWYLFTFRRSLEPSQDTSYRAQLSSVDRFRHWERGAEYAYFGFPIICYYLQSVV